MNDPESYVGKEKVVESFIPWLRKKHFDGPSWRAWRLVRGPMLLVFSLFAAGIYRLLGRSWCPKLVKKRCNLLTAYFEADLVVSCPGNFLYSGGRLSLWFILSVYAIAYGLLLRKPVYLFPQTIGPVRRSWERGMLRWLFPRIRLAFVRDDYSWQTLQNAGVDLSRCHLVPDLAFVFPSPDIRTGTAFFCQRDMDVSNSRPLLGVTVLSWDKLDRLFHRQEEYENAVASAIRSFVGRHGGHVLLFAQVHGPSEREDDRIPARRIRAALSDLGSRVICIEEELPAAALKAIYGEMDIFMGTRLHSNIFSLSQNVPVLAIAYQPKTHGIMSMLGLNKWVVNIEDVDSEKLSHLLEDLWNSRVELRRLIANELVKIEAEIDAIQMRIQSDFDEWSQTRL